MKYFRYLLIILLVALALWRLYPHLSDLATFAKLGQNFQIVWLILAIIAQGGQYLADGWGNQIALKFVDKKISLKDTVRIASVDVFAAHLLPIGEAGAVAASYYFYNKLGVSKQTFIFLAIAWGIITNIALIFFLIIATIFLPKLPNVPFHISDLTKFALIILVIISILIFLKRKTLFPIFNKFLQKFSWSKEFLDLLENKKSYIRAVLGNKLLLIGFFLAGFIYYASNIATLFFAFLAFGQVPSISVVAFAYTISILAGFLTLAPAGIGTSEATLFLIFYQFNVQPALAIATILTFRLVSFWLPIPIGLLSFGSMMKKKSQRVKISTNGD